MGEKPAKGTKCCEQVRDAGVWPRYHQCRKAAAVVEGGAAYCKQHAPSAVKARDAARELRFKNESQSRQRQFACVAALVGIEDPAQFMRDLRQAIPILEEALEERGYDWTAERVTAAEGAIEAAKAALEQK